MGNLFLRGVWYLTGTGLPGPGATPAPPAVGSKFCPMIGIVVVSHSSRLAEGVVELAREMGGPDVALEVAGGLGTPASSEAPGSRPPELAERTASSEAPGSRRPEVAERTGGA